MKEASNMDILILRSLSFTLIFVYHVCFRQGCTGSTQILLSSYSQTHSSKLAPSTSIMLYRSLWSCFGIKDFPVFLWHETSWKQYCFVFHTTREKWTIKTKQVLSSRKKKVSCTLSSYLNGNFTLGCMMPVFWKLQYSRNIRCNYANSYKMRQHIWYAIW